MIRIVAAVSLAFSVFYIVWRWGWTLNTEALWFSVPLLLAETYGLITAVFLTVTAWKLKQRTPGRAPAGKTVDVYVTCYDEPLTVVRKTALAAREIRYPHTTYILDDGKRDEIRAVAEELGVGYLRREGREHAKAGNLNHALRSTSGDFILQLDADHVPLPQIIDRLLGFLDDDRVAFVQSPQDFYNTDGFTYDVNQRARRIWEDQQLFFRVLQPGKDRLGAAFFVGSCALLRRKALEEIGGFATGSITEDIETSLLLHARGWKSAYLNESLAFGLAPASAKAFHVQHLRWGQGAMQVMRRYHPLRMKGLTLAQRIGYFDSLTTYLGGFQRLILYLAPITFFFTGAFPLRADATAFAAIFLPYIGLQLVSFKLLARGHGSLLLADRYSMAKFFTHIRAITGFSHRRLRFKVTPKAASDVPFHTYAPQLILIVVTAIAILTAVVREARADAAYEVPGWGALAFWVNLVFALWNARVAGFIVRMSLRIKQKRSDHRFVESVPVQVRVLRGDGKLAALDMAISENLNPFGVALRSMHPIDPGDRVELTLPLSTGAVEANGRVVHRRQTSTEYAPVFVHGIEFEDLDWEVRDAIELHCAHHATPLERQRYDEGGGTIAATFRRLRRGRRERRVSVGMPAQVTIFDHVGAERPIGFALLEDVSPTGARIMLDHPIAPDSLVRLQIPGTDVVTEAHAVFVHTLETALGIRFIVGLQTLTPATAPTPSGRPWFESVTAVAARYRTAVKTGVTASYALAARTTRTVTAGFRAMKPVRTLAPSKTSAPPAPRVVSESSRRPPALPNIPKPAPAVRTLPNQFEKVPVDEPIEALYHESIEEPVPAWVDETLADTWPAAQPVESAQEEPARDAVLRPKILHDDSVTELITARAGSREPGTPEPTQQTGVAAMDQIISSPDFQRVSSQDPVFAIRGGRAKIQGRIEVEDQLEIECEVNGEILCTGKLTIGVNGHVTANIQTVDAVIRGRYDGDLIATGSVEIAQTARVKGTVDAPELAIARGAIFKGTVSRPDDDESDLPVSSPVIALPAAEARKADAESRLESASTPSDTGVSSSAVNGQTRPAIQEVVVLSADAFAPSRTVTP